MKKKLKNKKTKKNKKHIKVKSNCPGVTGDITLMVQELGPALTMQFLECLENDRRVQQELENNFGVLYECEIIKKKNKKHKPFKEGCE